MNIPDSFQLGAHTITVLKNVKLADGTYGEWFEATKTIKLRPIKKAWGPHFADQVFLHEVAHAVLEFIGRKELSEDEGFVDSISEAVLQIILTMKGEEDDA